MFIPTTVALIQAALPTLAVGCLASLSADESVICNISNNCPAEYNTYTLYFSATGTTVILDDATPTSFGLAVISHNTDILPEKSTPELAVVHSSDTETAVISKSTPFGAAAVVPVEENVAVLNRRPPGGYGFPFTYAESIPIVVLLFLLLTVLALVTGRC
ncbi:hypothetical protein B0H13DRAFT_2318708 [Mycena leptocephala]|nr:hypothetical protein B0H13DRAFT_2318708 [Mycena leptocephala]